VAILEKGKINTTPTLIPSMKSAEGDGNASIYVLWDSERMEYSIVRR